MTLQLLCRFEAADADSWQSAYDADAEGRSDVGLSQLQVWRGADDGSAIWALYTVNERDKAQTWFDGPAKLSDAAVAEAHFLETA